MTLLRITPYAIGAVVFISAPFIAGAAIVPDACRYGGSGCTICHLGELAINLTTFLIQDVALPLTAALVAVGGITLLISGPSETRRTLGKKILTSTLIGIIIVLVAWLATDTIIKTLTDRINFSEPASLIKEWGPWNKFEAGKCPL